MDSARALIPGNQLQTPRKATGTVMAAIGKVATGRS